MPHYYACPYCVPSADTQLSYNRLHGGDSKPMYKCKKCGEEFLLDEDFKKTQKRKDKDG